MQVCARNANGYSPWSKHIGKEVEGASSTVTTTAITTPTATTTTTIARSGLPPRKVRIPVKGPQTLTVVWDEPADPTGLTGYEVAHKLASAANWMSAGSTGRDTLVITGLTAGTSYDVRVRASYGGPSSGWVEVSERTPDPTTSTVPPSTTATTAPARTVTTTGPPPTTATTQPSQGGVAVTTTTTTLPAGKLALIDVPATNIHRQAIHRLNQAEVFAGTECLPDWFCPGTPINRWTMAVWLVRALDQPLPKGPVRFSDVPADAWWAPFVERLAELGITQGCGDGTGFCPEEEVTRAQMAAFLVRAYNLEAAEPAGFADTAGSWAADEIDRLYAANITRGCFSQPLRYCPGRYVTRAQMAAFINRALSR